MPLQKNQLLAAIDQGRIPLGIQSFSGSPMLIEAMAAAGIDFVMLDTEHTPLSGTELGHLIRTAESAGIEPYVRIAENTDKEVRWALDLGARGLFLAGMETPEQMETMLQSANHPPYGHRGSCPATRITGMGWNGFGEYAQWARENVLMIPLLETPLGVANADAICAMEGVKVVCFGAGDYGQAVGAGVGAGMSSELVVQGFDKVLAAALAHGVHMIGFPYPYPTQEAAQQLVDKGVAIMTLSADTMIFRDKCKELRAALAPAIDRISAAPSA